MPATNASQHPCSVANTIYALSKPSAKTCFACAASPVYSSSTKRGRLKDERLNFHMKVLDAHNLKPHNERFVSGGPFGCVGAGGPGRAVWKGGLTWGRDAVEWSVSSRWLAEAGPPDSLTIRSDNLRGCRRPGGLPGLRGAAAALSGGCCCAEEETMAIQDRRLHAGAHWTGREIELESLIMAQIERWRHA